MKGIKVYIWKVILSIVLVASISAAHANDFDKTINTILNKDRKKFNIPGVSLAIYLPDSGLHTYASGYSNLKTKKLMTKQQLFDIGSMSKLFTAAVVLQAVDAGKCQLHETMAVLAKKYSKTTLAMLVKKYPNLRGVTIRQLMNHTSGLANGLNSKAYSEAFAKNPKRRWSPLELAELGLQQKPYFKPGEKGYFNYTNTEYLLLSYVAQAVNGASINASMQQMVKELHLKQTYIPQQKKPHFKASTLSRLPHFYGTPSQGGHSPRMIKTYQKYPAVILPGEKSLPGYDLTALLKHRIYSDFPAGGVVSTAADIAIWYHAIQSGQVLSKRLTLQLSQGVPTNAGMMYKTLFGIDPYVAVMACTYGLAVVSQHLPRYDFDVYFHGGREPGYIGVNMYLPKYKVSFALLSNMENDYIEYPQQQFAADIIAAIVDYEQHLKSRVSKS